MEIVIIASQKKELEKRKNLSLAQKNNCFAYIAWSILVYPASIIEMKF